MAAFMMQVWFVHFDGIGNYSYFFQNQPASIENRNLIDDQTNMLHRNKEYTKAE